MSYAGSGLQDATLVGCDAKRTSRTVTCDLVLRMPGRGPATLTDTDHGMVYRTLPS